MTLLPLHKRMMIMSRRSTFIFCGLSCLAFFVAQVFSQVCDKSKCKGPITYYEGLKCKPIYEKDHDCCAVSYDCSHHREKSPNKCYMNGHEYKHGEELREEDKPSPCDVCVCRGNPNGQVDWSCAVFSCVHPKTVGLGCWIIQNVNSCCNTEEMCPETGTEAVTCQFGGKTYKEGQRFYPDGFICQCLKGYQGENVAPYCRKSFCGPEIRYSREIRDNCAPVYSHWQSPSDTCPYQFQCQKENDKVIHKENEIGIETDNMKCLFGNLTMKIGDELNLESDGSYGSSCVKCSCEVPPVPTCRECFN